MQSKWIFGLLAAGIVGLSLASAAKKPIIGDISPPSSPAGSISERRFQAARAAVKWVSDSLNDPASLVWDNLFTNSDGSVICAEFRARNAFNGMVRKHVVMTSGSSSERPEAWNTLCLGKGYFDERKAYAF